MQPNPSTGEERHPPLRLIAARDGGARRLRSTKTRAQTPHPRTQNSLPLTLRRRRDLRAVERLEAGRRAVVRSLQRRDCGRHHSHDGNPGEHGEGATRLKRCVRPHRVGLVSATIKSNNLTAAPRRICVEQDERGSGGGAAKGRRCARRGSADRGADANHHHIR